MQTFDIMVTPHDPIIARDGRPFGFGQGTRMRSLDWLYPSVFAGSLRTMLGNTDEYGFRKNKDNSRYKEKITSLLNLSLTGPFLALGSNLYFPAPADFLVCKIESNGKTERVPMPLRPLLNTNNDGWGCSLPDNLNPVFVSQDAKPEKISAFWSMQKMINWLDDASGKRFDLPPEISEVEPDCGFLNVLDKDERFHVSINAGSGASEEGMLFKTIGLDFNLEHSQRKLHLAARVEVNEEYADTIASLDQFHPLGGERRLAHWKQEALRKPPTVSWSAPPEILDILKGKNLIRLVLATPAIFKKGWKPKWLNERSGDGRLVGSPPDSKVKLKLIAACVGRWKPISGWSYEHNRPKAIWRMVPAGSVYFFEVLDGNNADEIAENLWLRSVCDDNQNRRDGFGLALWGLWEYANIQNGDK